jgi:ribosomal protein S27AE
MAIQICPKCKQESFMWTSHGEPYIITTWHCSNCGYDATENELLVPAQDCPTCGDKTLCRLKDDEKEYWWCESCDRIQIEKNNSEIENPNSEIS